MKCVICRNGDTARGRVTVTLERETSIVIVRDVPADVCENCGEYYLTDDVTAAVMSLADEAVRRGREVEIVNYAA